MTGARPVRALVLAVAGLASIAACTSSEPTGADSTSVPPAVTTPVPTPTVTPPTTPAPPSTPVTTAPTTHPPATHPPASSAPPSAAHSTCPSLRIMVIRGSASTGREFAALQFTNTGSATCRLVGYPTVTLLRGGKPFGSVSQPASAAASARTLAPGAVAESTLSDYTMNCQAPLSDSIRVVAPGSTLALTRPAQLRGCVLRVGKLGPPE